MRHTTFNIMLLLLFLLLICRFEFCYSNNNSGCLEGERISLLQFKKSLIDRSNRLSSWTGLDCCKWEGVSCSSTTGHVLKLDLHNLQPTYDDIGDTYRRHSYCNNCLEGMVTEYNFRYGYSGMGLTAYEDDIYEDIKGLKLQYNKTLLYLRSIDLSGNHLVGMIPVELTSLHALKNLNLSRNHLSGAIPASIGNLSNIESLDLSRNLLSGRIPPSLSSLNFLSYLNLSFNNLHGRIPSGNQLQTLIEPSIYIGNEGLCGAPLPKSCPSPKASSVDQHTETSGDNHEFIMWFYAGLGPGFFVGFIGVLSILLFKRSWRFAYFKFLEMAYNHILYKNFIRRC